MSLYKRQPVWLLPFICCGFALAQVPARMQSGSALPGFFIANSAQNKAARPLLVDSQVRAFLQTPKGRVLFSEDGAYFALGTKAASATVDKLRRVGVEPGQDVPRSVVYKLGFARALAAKRQRGPRLAQPSGAHVNYLLGSRDQWQTQLPTYNALVYDEVWPGISLEYASSAEGMSCRLLLDGNSDVAQIALETGAAVLKTTTDGRLQAELDGTQLFWQHPLAYQLIKGQRVPVRVDYRARANGQFGFSLGKHDPDAVLVIEATLAWADLFGGQGGPTESAAGLALDQSDAVYLAGTTFTGDFPTTAGVFDAHPSGNGDVVVAKFNETGTQLIHATYFGGAAGDTATGIALDPSGNVYVAGVTNSANLPTTSLAYDRSLAGDKDGFVIKLSSDFATLIYGTYLGGDQDESVGAIAVDVDGHAFVVGHTTSSDFPTTVGAWSTQFSGFSDCFVTKLSPTGESLGYSTFLGGASEDLAKAMALDQQGQVYLAGTTKSANFPTTAGVVQVSYGGAIDGFVTKLASDGASLIYSTFLGGSGADDCAAIAVNGSGFAFVTGYKTVVQRDLFVTKLNPMGSGFEYDQTLTSISVIETVATSLAVDANDQAFLVGHTSVPYPTTPNAYSQTLAAVDAFVTKLDSSGEIAYSTYLGGRFYEKCAAVKVDSSGRAVVLGTTTSYNFPTTAGAAFPHYREGTDLFVTKLNMDGSALAFSTYIGGSGLDVVNKCATWSDYVYVTGYTASDSFPVTTGAYDEAWNGMNDIFVSQHNASGDFLMATFLGGSFNDFGTAIALDNMGAIYVTGKTESPDFPVTPGAYLETFGIYHDIFVAKLSPDGSDLDYATFIGAGYNDYSVAIAVGSTGNCVIAGAAYSGYPVTPGAFDTLAELFDVFVTQLNNQGSGLVYSTFLGGLGDDQCGAMAVDSQGQVLIFGTTDASDFPVTPNAYQPTLTGFSDNFVTKLNASGSGLVFSTLLGAEFSFSPQDVALAPNGSIYCVGFGLIFPTTPNAYSPKPNGGTDGIIVMLNSDGTALPYASYFGGSGDDLLGRAVVDDEGSLWVCGDTYSQNLPTTSDAYYPNPLSNRDGFLFKFENHNTLAYGTYLGGTGYDAVEDLAIDGDQNLYIIGTTYSPDFMGTPTTPNRQGFVLRFGCPLPRITVQPQDQSGCIGQALSLRVQATGDDLSYQWFKDEQPIIGADAATLTLSSPVAEDAGAYVCTISTSCGSVDSEPVQLILNAPPQILLQPVGFDGCPGEAVQFEVQATSGSGLSYRWRHDDHLIPGATSATLQLGSLSYNHAGTYSCLVSNGLCTTVSVEVELRVWPHLTLQAYSPVICSGDDTSLEVTAIGVGALAYQWRLNGEVLDGETSPVLALPGFTSADTGLYDCLVSDDCGENLTEGAYLEAAESLYVWVTPGKAQGLHPLQLEAQAQCHQAGLEVQWSNLTNGTTYALNTNPITLDPAPEQSMIFQVRVTDGITRNQITKTVHILVPAQGSYLDYDGDGCNTLADLYLFAPSWQTAIPQDPNGDGQVNVLDFLYFNTQDPWSCQPIRKR